MISQKPPFTRSQTANLILYFVLAAIVVAGLFYAPELFAQDGGEAAAAADESKKTLFDKIVDSGAFAVVLIACSVAVLTLAIFNFMQLSKSKFCPDDLKAALLDHMQNCRVRSAIDVAAGSPTYLGRMMAHSLPSVDATQAETLGREDVEDQMAEFTIRENRGHMTWIGYFSVIAQVAPMIGLLGTVVGMMGAFDKLSGSGGAQADQLAGDISLAMITTAGGLIVAIPSIFGFFFFRNRLNKLVADCHESGAQMMDASIAAVNAENMMAKVPEGLAEG
ncbi:MAG: MotA/TolQ/ExbB proton channel family protein [Verrucomicrobiota bacterium]